MKTKVAEQARDTFRACGQRHFIAIPDLASLLEHGDLFEAALASRAGEDGVAIRQKRFEEVVVNCFLFLPFTAQLLCRESG
ncbi:MAG: hypothetical protein KDK99_10615 [Verrucomicrobiales bacterium]|nr:hypothetical protein [Verrucomicrobiales bacterium]